MGQRLRRRTEPGPALFGDAGYTLIEVMVAMLLSCVLVTSVFSVTLTIKRSGSKGEAKIKAAAGARTVAALLKNYVTAETGTVSTVAPAITGPCVSAANNWSMTCNGVTDTYTAGPACGVGSTACYALAPGTHTLTGVMGIFENALNAVPPGNAARVSYFVDASAPVKKVSITTTWQEP